MESSTTSFSSLSGSATTSEGQTTICSAESSETIIGRSPPAVRSRESSGNKRSRDEGRAQSPHAAETWTKQPTSYNFSTGEHPLQAATSALLNVNLEGQEQAAELYAKAWSEEKGGLVDGKGNGHLVIQPPQSGSEFVSPEGKQPSVVRLAGSAMKLEQPPEGMSQHVEVIKTVPKQPSMAMQMSPKMEDHHILTSQSSMTVLQDLHNMRPQFPTYTDPYTGVGVSTAYARVDPSVSMSYAPLAGLGPGQAPFLPPGATGYNILPPDQTMYYRAADPYAYPSAVRPLQQVYQAESTEELLERMNRNVQPTVSVYPHKPLSVDMPSPVDSGIGGDLTVTPNKGEPGESFASFTELQQSVMAQAMTTPTRPQKEYTPRQPPAGDRIITNRESPIHIPKLENTLGFQYTLEAPISTSVRKEDDKMTYINKGQFYTITMEYFPDPDKQLKSNTVKSLLMVVFREDKTPEEELKCWQFWHSRQHSIKQRILDVDTKNSSGIVGNVEEIAHTGVQFYWNPNEQPAKINIAVQCLSTDFSNQKGVKGFPLHVQIDTYDDSISSKTPFHRGYCQIKVFCDKGANRKMLHEQRRDEKRRLQGRKKSDGEYHEPCERSEFYHMSNFEKQPALFIPPEDYERFPPLETFYTMNESGSSGMSPEQLSKTPVPTVENGDLDVQPPPAKRQKIFPSGRVMIFVRKPEDQVYTPLHLVPANVDGLLNAVSHKFGFEKEKITGLYKQFQKGATVKMDDDMIGHYCNEDTYLMHLVGTESGGVTLTLTETDAPTSSLVQQQQQS